MSLSYIYFTFSAIFNTVVSALLGAVIYFKNRQSKINQTLALFSFGVALWSLPYIFWTTANTAAETLLYFQLLHIAACYVSIFYLHFVVTWLDLYKKTKIFIYLGYITSTFFALNVFSPLFIRNMIPKFSMRYWAEPGIFYHFYLINFFGIFLYSCFLLYKNFKTEKEEIKKAQIKLMLLGMALSFLGGSTNYFLWYNINIPPYGNILASSFVILSAYAIIRYKLLNLKLIATEGFLLLINLFLIFKVIVSQGLNEYLINIVVLVGTLIISFLLLRSVKKEIERREEVTELARSLEQANLQLRELDQQKTEFLSIASHQLRTPLSVLKGYLDLIEDGAYGKPTKKMQQIFSNMDKSNEHLIKLVDDFLNVTRIEQGRIKFSFSKQDINKIIGEVVEELDEKAKEKELTLVWKANKDIKEVLLDGEKIRHVVLNYIDNAIKYSEKGGVVISLDDVDEGISVRVCDRGIGFTKQDEINFFQKFYRGKNVKQTSINGTGLGLYVCRKFIEAHNGRVWSKSAGLGKGSEFGFWIPRK